METVTRVREGVSVAVDAHNNPVPGAPQTTPIDGALFAPGGSSEPFEIGRTAVVSSPTLYFPRAWPDLRPTDRVIVRNQTYKVVGEPADWRNGFGGEAGGLAVTLEKVDG